MTESSSPLKIKITIHDDKYYTFDHAKIQIKYSILFPISEAVKYEEYYDDPFYEDQLSGPKWCKNCLNYGFINGTFTHYCANCVVHDKLPGCLCLATGIFCQENSYECIYPQCVLQTYLKDVDLSTIGDSFASK
jgi:hypothetical protein